MALRTFTTAGVNTLWSNAANWDTGVPVDTDTFALAAGQTCTFDVDQSAFAGLGASTIAAGTTLIASTTAGAYVLKMNADLTVNGTLQAGTSVAVPYPATCTFTIDFASASNSIVIHSTTGKVYFYCQEPVLKYVSLTAANSDGTVTGPLDVDSDISTDAVWSVGATVIICDLVTMGTSTRDNEEDTIAAKTSSTITLTGGLDSSNEIGAKVVLVTRNIRVINSTDYAFKNGNGCHIGAEIYNCTGGGISATATSVIAGCICCPAGLTTYAVTASNNTIDASIVLTDTGSRTALYSVSNTIIESGSLIAGFSQGTNGLINSFVYGKIAACEYAYLAASSIASNGEITGCRYGLASCFSCFVTADISNTERPINRGTQIVISNCELGKSIGGVVSSYSLYQCVDILLNNVVFSGTTEFYQYNSTTVRSPFNYTASFNHNQTENAYKAWCLGGIVTSQTASPPTGYTIFYDHEVESATYPCFRQYLTTVLPGTAIEVSAVIRNTDGIDVSATSPIDLRPRLEIIDVFADPLVDSTQTALDSDPIADADGSDTSWQNVDVIWANTGDSPRQVYVRIICYSHDASTHTIDEAWSVANYQDQINSIYNKLPTNYIMGSSVVTDKDDEIDAILLDTGTTLDGKLNTAQADLNIITGTNGVLIDDAAITEDKFDNTTAFPVAKEDAGDTEIARTGADGDTLETLSDQLDLIQTDVDTIEANTGKVLYGSVDTGGIPKSIQTGSVTGFVEDERL